MRLFVLLFIYLCLQCALQPNKQDDALFAAIKKRCKEV